jgi:hypothetical protein
MRFEAKSTNLFANAELGFMILCLVGHQGASCLECTYDSAEGKQSERLQ